MKSNYFICGKAHALFSFYENSRKSNQNDFDGSSEVFGPDHASLNKIMFKTTALAVTLMFDTACSRHKFA
jgi:hypothetical protein